MKKRKLSRREVIEDLKKLFGHKKNSTDVVCSEHGDDTATFMVNKHYLERFDVLERLQNYFYDVCIDKGQCRIESITFVYTTFFIEKRIN